MNDLLHREYNGWEDKLTWLVHLHLSNEQALFLEIEQVVARERNDEPAGRLIEMWVRVSITNWMNRLPGPTVRMMRPSACWSGTCLAGSCTDRLERSVTLVAGNRVISNVFTMTLMHSIQQSQLLYIHVEVVLRDASNVREAADGLKAWFEALCSVG